MKSVPSTEERIWAVLSHLSAIAFGMGILLPVIGWSEQRRKSNYASFQCLQALGYQSLGYTVWILLTLVIVIVQSIGTLAKLIDAAETGSDFEALTTMAMSDHFFVTFGLIGLYVLLPMIGAFACVLGKDFRYPILGDRLVRYLGYDPADNTGWLNEDYEDRWVAAMGHFSVIIILWGMVLPLTAWIMQGKRSTFLKFQSMQALFYQGGTLLLYFGAGFVYLFGFLVFMVIVGLNGNTDMNSSMVIGLVVFAISMLITFVIILIVPLLHILGQWAGYRVLTGDNYRYPILGGLIEKRISKNPKLIESGRSA